MGYFLIENHDFSNSAIFDRNPKIFYSSFQRIRSFSGWNDQNLVKFLIFHVKFQKSEFLNFFFEILKNFTRSKIRSNHWVQWSTVQLRKYVEREFKMRLMIALIKFSRVKFEIFEIFLQILIFWCHVSNTCWSESQCENFSSSNQYLSLTLIYWFNDSKIF